MGRYLDLQNPEHTYLLGFIYGDGHLTKLKEGNLKGCLSIEINQRDIDLLEAFKQIIPVKSTLTTRTRTTNFGNHTKEYVSTTATLAVHDLDFRLELNELGVPYGKKSMDIEPPKIAYSEADFWRGYIDANGSLGTAKSGLPFISMTTASESMAHIYLEFVKMITGRTYTSSRNKRDQIFNITIMREPAQEFILCLYYPNCLALERKREKAMIALNWLRPEGMKVVGPKHKWTEDEINYVQTHSIEESVKYLRLFDEAIESIKRRTQKKMAMEKK